MGPEQISISFQEVSSGSEKQTRSALELVDSKKNSQGMEQSALSIQSVVQL